MRLGRGGGLIFLCALLSASNLLAQQNPLNRRVTVNFNNIPLQNALTKLSMQYEIPISFEPTLEGMRKNVNVSFSNATVSDILRDLLNDVGLGWRYLAEEIVVVPARKYSTLSGRIQDAENGEDLIGANMQVFPGRSSTTSNSYGFYSLTLPEGSHEIWLSCMGYIGKKIQVVYTGSDQTLNILLEKKVNELREVTVSKSLIDSLRPPGFAQQLQWDLLRDQPYFRGEADVVKALQMQNGVAGMTEGSSSMFVRGGNRDQNLIMLDEAVVYNPAHLFGLTSVFNPDALKNIELYKDDIPANFGGRLSSVIDARMADGDDKTFRVKGGASLLSGRFSAEGPIVREKGSFLIAGRRSLASQLNKDFGLYNLKAAYYDLNFKCNYRLNASSRLFISAYLGRDRVSAGNGYLNEWGNQTATLRWNHIFNPKLFLNFSAIYSSYRNALNINADASEGMDNWVTGIRDLTLKSDFAYFRKPGNQMHFGFNGVVHLFKPGETTASAYNDIPRARAAELALYYSQMIAVGARLKVLYGLRVSLFRNFSSFKLYTEDDAFSKTKNTVFARLEPRLTIRYALFGHSMVQLSYNRNYQYLQLLQNDELAFSSLETWIPSSDHVRPQYSDIYAFTYKWKLPGGTFSLGAYYKFMGNQLELVDHAQVISNPLVEDQLRTGKSDAYGLELGLAKQVGNFRATAFYTWSRVFRTMNEINNGKRYAANYDIPHTGKLSVSYQPIKSLQINSYFTYTSGRPATLPTGYYIQNGVRVPIYSGRNLERMPDYHRWDLNICWRLPISINNERKWINTFTVGIYNIYGRRNPLFYKINPQEGNNSLIEEQTFSGMTPVFSYSLVF